MGSWTDLDRRARRDPGRPVVTYLDLVSGERMELSGATLLNAAAKTAGLLRDDLDVDPGDRIGVDLPLHWQLPVVCAALDATGATADLDSTEGSSLAFVDRNSLTAAATPIVVSLQPFGLPDPQGVPANAVDHARDARLHPDAFVDDSESGDPDALSVIVSGARLSRADIEREAGLVAAELGLGPGGRLLVAEDEHRDALRRWLLCLAVPLVADASVVLVRHPGNGDLDAVRRDERITAEDAVRGGR